MTAIRARIDRDGHSSLENILVTLDVRSMPNGLRSWRGSFQAPLQARIEIGDELRITLADGRSGKALIQRITTGSIAEGALVLFHGTGPLA